MAIEVALEDDLFFADLNRQISLLIEEDDDDDDDFQVANYSSITPQVFSGRVIHHPPIIASSHSQYMYQESYMRDMCKGTGVFIPQSSQPRRKYKQRKLSAPQSYAAKFNNKLNISKERTTNNVTAHTNMFPPAYDTGMISRY